MIEKRADSLRVDIGLNASIFVEDLHVGNLYFDEEDSLRLEIAPQVTLDSELLLTLEEVYGLANKKMAAMQEELAKIYKEPRS